MWRWMIRGLGGLIAMMAALHAEHGPALTAEEASDLDRCVRDLQALAAHVPRQ